MNSVRVGSTHDHFGNMCKTIVITLVMLLVSLAPLINSNEFSITILEEFNTSDNSVEVWSDGGQAWPQFGRTGDRLGDVPLHGPEGGAGLGHPSNASELLSIVDPKINWEYGNYEIGTDALATPIANLENSITKDIESNQRCGEESLFIIIIQTDEVSGTEHSFLRIIEGEDADLAWQVDLGATDKIKSSPVIVDIDNDGKQEIIVTYDAGGSLFVEAWSPRLSCSVTGWAAGSHSSEILWTWSDETLQIGSGEGPYISNILGNHRPTTQPLLADLDLDGDAELVLTLIDKITDDPVVLALPLPATIAPNPLWQVSLDKGSHPSDPAFAQTDDSTAYILLTTIEANSGGMWIWKIESDTGDSSWDGGLSMNNIDGDNDVPHIRLPGPIIANLDSDSVPEMIITIPTDADGSASADGAEYRGLEISDGEELWSFNSVNGYADAPPTAIDTNNDSIHDRVCWITWWQTTTARHGEVGCHDVSGTFPYQVWNRDLEQSSGTPNDEIAVAAVSWMDIDGQSEQEIIVAYGRTLWAFDGEEGTSSSINSEWANQLELSNRVWSTPSLADVDGDATLDIAIGNIVISTGMPDVRPLTDNRSIEFNPNAPDPGEIVTITAFFENSGTETTEEGVDAILYADGEEIGRHRSGNLQPIDPTGPGSFASFEVEWSGDLGEHTFELRLDPYKNITQTRYDNDFQIKTLSIIPTYNASFEISTDPIRVNPGESNVVSPTIRSNGRLSGIWSIAVDSTNLPQGWSWNTAPGTELQNVEIDVGGTWKPEINVNAPNDALGSDSGYLILKLSLDQDNNISVESTIAIEANRTRGLSLRGPDGTALSQGYGLLGEYASTWIIIENVGNALENQISISWDNTNWGSDLKLFNSEGEEEAALILNPGESKEMTANIIVPSNVEYGEIVNTPLIMCVGNNEEEICQTIILTFIASRVTVEINHLRSVPTEELEWTITADIPSNEGYLNWSLNEMGMLINGWNWSYSGQVSSNNENITIQGEPGSRSIGKIMLNMPHNSPPMYHLFSESGISSGVTLRFSLEVLQIYSASLTISSPTEVPSYIDINEEKLVILRLENKGNGEDSFEMSHKVLFDQNLTSDPGIIVTFSNNPLTLEAGSLRSIPITILFPPSTPARVNINIEIIMKSIGDPLIEDSKLIITQAKQDHLWSIDARINGDEIISNEYGIDPGNTIEVNVSARNLGNMIDDIKLVSSIELNLISGDSSIGWIVSDDSKNEVLVNDTIEMKIYVEIPQGALVGSMMDVMIYAISNEEEVGSFSFQVGVNHIPAWNVIASDANLEIEENGSQVELTIVQLGNMESRPYVSVWIVGESGWEVVAPLDLPIILPGNYAQLILNITAPETALYGKSVELHVRIREGDSSATSEITLPIRIAATYNFSMIDHDSWILSSSGGYPLVSLKNHGNSPTTITLQLLSLPQGWEVYGPDKIVLASNEQLGLPIKLMPSDDWNGEVKTIRILAYDGRGNQQEIFLDTKFSKYSWSNSPFINSYLGDSVEMKINGIIEDRDIIKDNQGNILEWTGLGIIFPSKINGIDFGNLSINDDDKLQYILNSYQINSRSTDCSITDVFGNINSSCTIAPGNNTFPYTIILTDDKGKLVDLKLGSANNNENEIMINLTAENWNPEPGVRTLKIRILDSKGFEINKFEKDFDIRKTNWNIGLTSIDLIGTGNNQVVEITAERYGHSQLLAADCKITLKVDDYESTKKIDMSTRVILTPKTKFDRPIEIPDGSEVVVTIGCAFPWDIDSNQVDNEIRKVLNGGIVDDKRNIITSLSLITAFTIIILFGAGAWLLKNRKEMKEFEEMTQNAIKNRILLNKESEVVISNIKIDKSEQDEIEIKPTVNQEETLQQISNIKENINDVVNEDEMLDDFERRLKRIRRDG
jgi:hypothetical protein